MLKKRLLLFLFSFFTFLLVLAGSVGAGTITNEGNGTYGVELDVEFTYDIDESDLGPWRAAFNRANLMIWQASRGQLFLKKINFKICPVDIESKRGGSSADIFVYQAPAEDATVTISHTIGTLSQSEIGPINLFATDALDFKSENVGHEIAHYLFRTWDEYAKPDNSKYTVLPIALRPGDTPESRAREIMSNAILGGKSFFLTEEESDRLAQEHGGTSADYQVFCTDQQHKSPHACVMCGDKRTALNNPGARSAIADYYAGLCTDEEHVRGLFLSRKARGQDTLYRLVNEQNYIWNESCAATAQKELARSGVGNLDFSRSIPTGGAPATEYEVVDDCSNTVVLLLDKSGSMDGRRIVDVRRAAVGLIDSLDDDTRLGIVWFDSQPRAAVELTNLDENRFLAKQAIYFVEASGGTRIGFGLGLAYELVRRARENPDQPRSREVIFLMTDGESSDDTTTVVNTIRNDGVEISTVAIGNEVDADLLGRLAAQTGGQSYFADDDDIVRAVTLGVTENLDDYELVESKEIEGTTSELSFDIDSYIGSSLVRVALNDIDAIELDENSFTVTGPQGPVSGAEIRLSVEDDNNATAVFVLPQPEPGTYTIGLPGSRLRDTTQISALSLAQSNTLHLLHSVNGLTEGAVQFPEPVILQAALLAKAGAAADLNVQATVVRPDGTEVTVRLYDDGNKSHGDRFPGDGVYSNRFQQYTDDGNYLVRVVCDNSAQTARATYGKHSDFGENPEGLFDPFRRERTFSFQVSGFSQPGSGELTVSPLDTPPPELITDRPFEELSGLVVNGFHVVSGPGQPVILNSLTMEMSSEFLDSGALLGFQIYHDSDSDGFIDFDGEYSSPIAQTDNFETEGNLVTIYPNLEILASSELNLLVAVQARVLPEIEESEEAPVEAGFPLALVSLALAYLSRKRRLILGICLAMSLGFFVVGCGSDNGSFVFTQGQSASRVPEEPEPLPEIQIQGSLDLRNIHATGAIDGAEVPIVINGGEESVEGNQVRVL